MYINNAMWSASSWRKQNNKKTAAYKTMGPYAKAGSGKPTRVRKKG